MQLRVSLAFFTLVALALLAIAGTFAPRDPAPAAPRPSLRQLVALRRFAVHDAAVQRNAAAKARCEAGHATRRSFATLFGTEPATPGPAFDRPGKPYQIETTERRHDLLMIERRATVADSRPRPCDPKDDPAIYCPFECLDRAEIDCWDLTQDLTEAWGTVEHAAWHDRSGSTRALVYFADNRCTLQLARSVPQAAWIAATATAEVPLALIGAPTSRLPEAARMWPVGDDEVTYQWELGVTGDHMLAATLTVHATHERIDRLEVHGAFLADGGADEIHELVRPYRHRFAIELATDAHGFDLAISASHAR